MSQFRSCESYRVSRAPTCFGGNNPIPVIKTVTHRGGDASPDCRHLAPPRDDQRKLFFVLMCRGRGTRGISKLTMFIALYVVLFLNIRVFRLLLL